MTAALSPTGSLGDRSGGHGTGRAAGRRVGRVVMRQLTLSRYCVLVAAVFVTPALFVLWRTVRLDASVGDTVSEIPGPLWRTIQLAVLVSGSTAVLGTLLAWTTMRTDLPFRRMWRVVLLLPIVLPSFVGAGAFIAGLAPDGFLYRALDLVGIEPPRRFRGLGASWLVLTMFTYPYVMLPVSARLASLRSSHEESARLLGCSRRAAFLRVTLPELRASILGGALLVFLYSLSEFGAVQLLGYDTLTRVIFATRQVDRPLSFACATVLLVLAVVVVVAERRGRGTVRRDLRAAGVAPRVTRLGWRRVPATLTCLAVATLGLVAPLASLAVWTRRGLRDGRVAWGDLVEPAVTTAWVGVVTAVVTVAVVLPVAVASTRRRSAATDAASGAIVGGFAIPGLVIALALAVLALNTTGVGWLYQTVTLLVIAYVVHFGSQALASTEQAVRAVPDRIREQGRLLEAKPVRRLLLVELPLMRPGLVTAGGLVLLATVKELPATLLLAPPEFETLATDIWGSFNEGFYAATGLASLGLVALTAALTWLLVIRNSEVRR